MRTKLALGLLLVAASCADDAPDDTTPAPELVCAPGELRACYAGPEGTEGVGLCLPGAEQCLPHGRGWGPCQGQVLPVQERCDEPEDENCDGLLTCGDTVWAQRLGSESTEIVNRISSDEAGNLYTIGYYRDPFPLGRNAVLAIDASRDLMFAKFAPDGEPEWSFGIYSESNQSGWDVHATADGSDLLFAAAAAGEIIVGEDTIPSNGGLDLLITRLTGDGELVWSRRYGDDSDQQAITIAHDPDGNIVVAGLFDGTIDFGGDSEPVTTGGFNRDMFVAKLDPDGNGIWAFGYNGPLDQIPRDIAVGPDGRIVIGGDMAGSVDFGGGELVAHAPSIDAFVVVLDGDGSHVFSHVWGAGGLDLATGVAIDSEGNVIVAGRFEDQVRFGAQLFDGEGAAEAFVVKLDPAGEHIWAQRLSGGSDHAATDTIVDSRDRVIVTGYYEGNARLGETTLPPSGLKEPNVVVFKLEPDGKPVWARGVAVDGEQDVSAVRRAHRSLALAPDDHILFGTFVQREFDFGEGVLEDLGGGDLLIAKLAP